MPGDFEYSIVADTVDTDVVPTARKHYEKRFTARIKAFVKDDLTVTEAEIDGEFSSDLDGVRTGPAPIRRRFRDPRGGMPDLNALMDAVAVTGDMAAAALMWNASMIIYGAQRDWREPNACAELQFDPPSETRAVTPGETVEVRVKYRTRDAQQPIPPRRLARRSRPGRKGGGGRGTGRQRRHVRRSLYRPQQQRSYGRRRHARPRMVGGRASAGTLEDPYRAQGRH